MTIKELRAKSLRDYLAREQPKQSLREYMAATTFSLLWPKLEGTVSAETARKMDAEGERKAAQGYEVNA